MDMKKLLDIYGTSADQGFVPTSVEGVRFFWNRTSSPRSPRVYDPALVFVGQGYQTGYSADRQFRYDQENYLILSLPAAFEVAIEASAEEPMLGIFVNIDPVMLNELTHALCSNPPEGLECEGQAVTAFEPAQHTDEMHQTVLRLIDAMQSPLHGAALGPAIVREVIFHALTGSHGPALWALNKSDTVNAKVSRSLAQIHKNYNQTLQVEELAEAAGMSLSTFHRSFKKITGDTPLQYLKKIRLHKARSLIQIEGLRTSAAAHAVGYESPSQFSREFKRHFKHSPSEINF